ncbi:MAG: hypothetical protein ACKVOR_11770 [Flavobacteriales bacterium]
MELTPFSLINQYIRERLIHPQRYTCKEFSFLKIFQHGLSFAINRFDYKLIKNYLQLPYPLQLAIYWLKSIRQGKSKSQYAFKEFVILDPGRVVKGDDGNWHSIYFDRISSVIGRERLTWISTKDSPGFHVDYEISFFKRYVPYPDEYVRKLLKEMIAALRNAERMGQFSAYEMKHLRSAMHIFFEEFRFYYHLFKGQQTRTLLFICHYHSEGLIAALKMLGIRCVEIQHGLIATNDLYYVYHEQFASIIGKSFFPDTILTYGAYWKRILGMGCEYRTSQVQVAGDYLYRLADTNKERVEKENVVLVCAQKNLHMDYVNYGKQLAAHLKNHPEWRAIMKLHPLEKNKPAYEELKQHGIEIVDLEIPLDTLLRKSKIQISIYSTTFYDALGFDMVNFSLQDFGNMSDYASDMIEEGVAAPLLAHEDPVEKYRQAMSAGHTLLPREEVYAPFDEELVRQLIFDMK